MTKYEWFKEFKNNLKDIPKEEADKAIEYYEELFEDKIDAGKSEMEAVLEFGSPSIASTRIRAEVIDERQTESTYMGVGSIYETVKDDADFDLEKEVKTSEKKKESVKEEREATEAKEEVKTNKEKTFGETLLFVLELFVFSIVYFACFVTFWSIIASLIGCMCGFIGGGIGGTVLAIIGMFTNSAAFGFFNMGLCLILLAIGIIIAVFIKPLIMFSIKITKEGYDKLFGWYTKNKGGNK